MTLLSWLLLAPTISTSVLALDIPTHYKRTQGGIHLPIVRRVANQQNDADGLERRGTQTGAIGLGNFMDLTYQVMVQVGSVETPVVLDTGSSDLWVISDQCTGNCTNGLPTYPQASFQSEGLSADLRYGDSRTGTFADGLIGRDTAAVAGLSVDKQLFAAVNKTNTSLAESGAAGIFGLGFPINSVMFTSVFAKEFPQDINSNPGKKRDAYPDDPLHVRGKRGLAPGVLELRKRQAGGAVDPGGDLLSTYATNGPLIARLAAQGNLAQPMVAITLSRNAIQVGGNEGLLSIGELPAGISNDSLTWVPVRLYTPKQGGPPPSLASPNEVYPVAWEIPLDDVYVNGQVLPKSTLGTVDRVTSLVDTGNSLMRGPEDVVAQALQSIATKSDGTFPCLKAPTIEFQIGGKKFPIDPRDIIAQAFQGDTTTCTANLVATDPPNVGALYSWSIGDPFLKSALVAYYFGNLTHPSVDPPRIGFLSTVPADADAQLTAAVAAATGSFPAVVASAPTGAPAAAGTGTNGVPQAGTTAGAGGTTKGGKGSAASAQAVVSVGAVLGALAAGVMAFA